MKRLFFSPTIRTLHDTFSMLVFSVKSILISGLLVCILYGLIAIGCYLHPYLFPQSPFSSMKHAVTSVSSAFLIDMLGMELPRFHSGDRPFTFSQENIILFIFRLLTNLNPHDPKSILASELPVMQSSQTTVLRSSKAPNPSEPIDLEPAPERIHSQIKASQEVRQVASLEASSSVSKAPIAASPASSTINPKQHFAFIYQTHSNESFLPELQGVAHPTEAYHEKINITLVGKRLAEQLHQAGIGAIHSDRIYPNEVKEFSYPKSYQYSLRSIQEAIAVNPQITYFFDIHRDSSKRDRTTIEIAGQSYAQIYFIVGGKNANWKQNEAFANEIHQILEQQAPGLSKGIHAKASKESNGVYNQDISRNSILIEIGGPYNSLSECYRTVDVLASAISEVILQVKKVDANG